MGGLYSSRFYGGTGQGDGRYAHYGRGVQFFFFRGFRHAFGRLRRVPGGSFFIAVSLERDVGLLRVEVFYLTTFFYGGGDIVYVYGFSWTRRFFPVSSEKYCGTDFLCLPTVRPVVSPLCPPLSVCASYVFRVMFLFFVGPLSLSRTRPGLPVLFLRVGRGQVFLSPL